MPDEERRERGTKRICLMGAARALLPEGTAGNEALGVSKDAEAIELLALLVLGREFLPPQEVKEEDRADGEVRRDWLAATLYPDLFPQEDGRRTARERVRYLLDKLHPRPDRASARNLRPPSLPIRVHLGERERAVARVTWKAVSVDVLALREAARQMHLADKQQEVIALGDRPLLEGMTYPWLQTPAFQKVRAELDAYVLAALARQADSQVFQMQQANQAGRLADADACRTRALPLLDTAAERLRGYGELRGRPEYAPLLPFEAQFLDLRRRAAYPLPDAGAADIVSTPPAHNLPSPATSFVGRKRELADIQALLASGRMVTLTGMGGCGKTRLAVQAAWEQLGHWEGVRLVEMAALTAPDQVPQTIATALGVKEQQGVSVTDALVAFLQGRRMLLLLDNCEHLLRDNRSLDDRSEKDDCGTTVARLLHACPTLSVLATSRTPLNIGGEHLCPLSPLPCPAPGFLPADAPDPVATLLGYDAARLFLDRVREFQPFTPKPENVAPVAAICAALDGIPLALELAAARVKALPLERIAEMLSDRFGLLTRVRREAPSRHKTLRAVLDWSYDPLTESEKMLLCRLSVFAGGWTLDAAKAVGAPEGAGDFFVLNLLTSLVDKSLVIFESASDRYRMLETVRQYAEDRLRERGEREETRRRHNKFYFHLAEEAYQHLNESDQKHWLDRLDADVNNLRATVTSYSESRSADEEWLRLTAWLSSFWRMRGYLSEGLSHLQKALAQVEDASASTRALAFEGAGNLSHHLGDYEAARSLLERGLELMRGIDDDEGVAKILTTLGAFEFGMQELAEARVRFQETLEIFRRTNDTRRIPTALVNLGAVAIHQKDYLQARSLFVEGLERFRQIKDEHNIAHSLYSLANVEQEEGNSVEAERLLQESLRTFRAWKDQWRCILVLETMIDVAVAQGQYKRTGQLWGAAEGLRQRLGTPLQPFILDQYNQMLSGVVEKFGTTSFEAALAEGRAMTWEQAVAFALGEDTP